MKKTLIMASLLVFAAASNAFAVETVPAKEVVPAQKTQCNCQRPQKGPDFQKRHVEFEKRLKLTDEQKAKIEKTAQNILNARKLYPKNSLADMYGETMYLFPELLQAHRENDRAVMQAYGFSVKDMTESKCVAELMKLYQTLTKKD